MFSSDLGVDMNTKITLVILLFLFFVVNGCNDDRSNDLTVKNGNLQQKNVTRETELFFPDTTKNSCLRCHQGIATILDPKSGMMQSIYKLAGKAGYKDNDCIVCHGGNPSSKDKNSAHRGTIEYFLKKKGPKEFYPNPGSVWINNNTCGLCHDEQVRTQFTSLMFTEAGKIQGTTWGFGGLQGYKHNVANISVKQIPEHKILGTETYKKYMQKLMEAEPQIFPGMMKGLPEAPTDEELAENPSLAAYTYLRAECQRCHLGVKGQQVPGDYRGAGCSACHIPYSGKGLYEGDDKSIDKSQPGKMLIHTIQATREAKVKIHGKSYSGIPTKTCTSCHNRGRRIGVSYEGLMETAYHSPFMSNGDPQAKIHKKNYIHLKSDIHLQKGMLCQDCHTSGDIHGTGFLSGAISGAVEIECEDCHGTPEKYPWELPFGYGDEIAGKTSDTARGVSQTVPKYLKKGWVAERGDGYLFSARGNPMPHIVKSGDSIILHSAAGKDIVLIPLKKLFAQGKISVEGKVAMKQIDEHIEKMECYTCHATWAPQCYGCHIKIDYSDLAKQTDWVKVAENHDKNGRTADELGTVEAKNLILTGKVTEERSYLRWEDPPLVVNGEHRISPAIPGCQTTVTIIDKNGKTIVLNNIFKIPNVEGAGDEGQLAIDMAPLHPHTVQEEARTCESCHNNSKAMGYGINGGDLYSSPDKNIVMDLTDIKGNPIAMQIDTQFNAIANLKNDWSVIIDGDGNQVQTVGHHFSGSRALNSEELSKLDRRGVCISCHRTVPDEDLAVDIVSHIAEFSDFELDKEGHDSILNKSVRVAAWAQVLGGLVFIVLAVFLLRRFITKRKSK